MSRFTRINTAKERDLLRPELLKIRQIREEIRSRSLKAYMESVMREITLRKSYPKRNGKSIIAYSWKRYDSGMDPAGIPATEDDRFNDIVIKLVDVISGAAVSIERAHFSPKSRTGKRSYVFSADFTALGKITLLPPHKQIGLGKFRVGVSGFEIGKIRKLLEDLSLDIVSESPYAGIRQETEGVTYYELAMEGEYLLR